MSTRSTDPIHVWCDLCGAGPKERCKPVGAALSEEQALALRTGEAFHRRRRLRAQMGGKGSEPEAEGEGSA